LPIGVGRIGQVGLPRELVDQLGGVAKGALQRAVELRALRDHPGAPDLEDELLPQLLALGVERLLELLQAAPAKGAIGRPAGLVERPAGRGDGTAHLRGRPVGDLAEDLLGGWVDVGEGRTRVGADERAVDQHPGLGVEAR
jgi:hypothetical protein